MSQEAINTSEAALQKVRGTGLQYTLEHTPAGTLPVVFGTSAEADLLNKEFRTQANAAAEAAGRLVLPSTVDNN